MIIRPETTSDDCEIRELVSTPFRDAPHASGTEANIVDALRQDGALRLSLVAVESDRIVGHVAFSTVEVEGGMRDWFGLGPVAVHLQHRRQGIGQRLIDAGLGNLRERGAGGCVVLGDPAYYRRFGFLADPALVLTGVLPEYFQALVLGGNRPKGEVRYHPAFGVA